jgi:hypothetical protein
MPEIAEYSPRAKAALPLHIPLSLSLSISLLLFLSDSRAILSNSATLAVGFIFAARCDICIEIVAPGADARLAL